MNNAPCANCGDGRVHCRAVSSRTGKPCCEACRHGEVIRCDACDGELRLDGTCSEECQKAADDLRCARGLIYAAAVAIPLWMLAWIMFVVWQAGLL